MDTRPQNGISRTIWKREEVDSMVNFVKRNNSNFKRLLKTLRRHYGLRTLKSYLKKHMPELVPRYSEKSNGSNIISWLEVRVKPDGTFDENYNKYRRQKNPEENEESKEKEDSEESEETQESETESKSEEKKNEICCLTCKGDQWSFNEKIDLFHFRMIVIQTDTCKYFWYPNFVVKRFVTIENQSQFKTTQKVAICPNSIKELMTKISEKVTLPGNLEEFLIDYVSLKEDHSISPGYISRLCGEIDKNTKEIKSNTIWEVKTLADFI